MQHLFVYNADTMITESELRNKIAQMCYQKSQVAVAKEFNVPRQTIGSIIAGKRHVTDEIAEKLGYKRQNVPVIVDRLYAAVEEDEEKVT